jgi:hypothetical protein
MSPLDGRHAVVGPKCKEVRRLPNEEEVEKFPRHWNGNVYGKR